MNGIGVPVALAVLVGCAEAPAAVDACLGGDPPDVDIGQGDEAWVPWFEGDEIPLERSGWYGFWLTLRTAGLDTRERMSTSLAFTVGDDPTPTEIEVPI